MEEIIESEQVNANGFVVRGEKDGYWFSHTHYFNIMNQRVDVDLKDTSPELATEHREYTGVQVRAGDHDFDSPEHMPDLTTLRAKKNALRLNKFDLIKISWEEVLDAQTQVQYAQASLLKASENLTRSIEQLNKLLA